MGVFSRKVWPLLTERGDALAWLNTLDCVFLLWLSFFIQSLYLFIYFSQNAFFGVDWSEGHRDASSSLAPIRWTSWWTLWGKPWLNKNKKEKKTRTTNLIIIIPSSFSPLFSSRQNFFFSSSSLITRSGFLFPFFFNNIFWKCDGWKSPREKMRRMMLV